MQVTTTSWPNDIECNHSNKNHLIIFISHFIPFQMKFNQIRKWDSRVERVSSICSNKYVICRLLVRSKNKMKWNDSELFFSTNGTIISFVSHSQFSVRVLSAVWVGVTCVTTFCAKTGWKKMMNALLFFRNWPWSNLSRLSGRFGLFKEEPIHKTWKENWAACHCLVANPCLIQVFNYLFLRRTQAFPSPKHTQMKK